MDGSQTESSPHGKWSARIFCPLLKRVDEYVPRHRDSAIASVRPEPSFLDFFRQSLIYTSQYCTEPGCCSFTARSSDPGTHPSPRRSNQQRADPGLTYPLILFEELKDLPRRELLHSLATRFQNEVLPSLPFLTDVEYMSTIAKELPFYLLLAQALLGAIFFSDSNSHLDIEKLWHASTSLLLGAVEVDNTLGSTVSWQVSVCCIMLCIFTKTLIHPGRDFLSCSPAQLGDIVVPGIRPK